MPLCHPIYGILQLRRMFYLYQLLAIIGPELIGRSVNEIIVFTSLQHNNLRSQLISQQNTLYILLMCLRCHNQKAESLIF